MPAYCNAMVTASSHGGALGGTYTATLGAFSSGTASMLLASISPRIPVTRPSSTGSTFTPPGAPGHARAAGYARGTVLRAGYRPRRLLWAGPRPRPPELAGRRGRALPGHPRHSRDQGERRPLLQGIQPDRDPARQQEDFG